MGKRWVWAVGGALVIIACVLALSSGNTELPTIRFADGSSTRVLKVSFGTNHVFSAEPLWKKALRKALPPALQRPLGPPKEYRRTTTSADSLALFLEPLPTASGKQIGNLILATPIKLEVEVLSPKGRPYGRRAAIYWYPSSAYPIILQNYPRGEKELSLRFYGNDSVDIKVPNPHPTQRASWSALPLPQTNRVADTEIVLKEWRRAAEPILMARSVNGMHPGWMQWRTTVFDTWGNWEHSGFPVASGDTVFKLAAEGFEYLSGGFVQDPTNHQHQVFQLRPRMTNWGVRFAALFGPGSYEVSNTFDVTKRKSGLIFTNTLKASGSSWIVQCVQPVTLSVSERAVSEVRLRERLPHNQGRVFVGRPADSASKGGLVAQLFALRLVANATNLEAEVVVRWPAVEFFVQKPE